MPAERAAHKTNSNAITEEWKAFINEWDEKLKKKPELIKDAANATIEKAFSLAEKFGYDISKVRRYRAEAQIWGQSLDKLWNLHNKFGKINIKVHPRWAAMAKTAGKRLGKTFLKICPVVGYVVTAFIIISAVSDPVGALSQQLEVSRDTAGLWLAGNATAKISLWNPVGAVQSVEMSTGEIVSVGDHIWHWNYIDAQHPEKGTKFKKWYEIKKIIPAVRPGYAKFSVDDGPGNKLLESPELGSISTPVPDN